MNLPDHPAEYGQIRPDSLFGRQLRRLARKSTNIVELGTWKGLGSTWCLALGMLPGARLWTVELNSECVAMARQFHQNNPAITFLCGTIVRASDMEKAPNDPFWQMEANANDTAEDVLPSLPERIDLLLIDGGEWSGYAEFRKLGDRAKVLALDDINNSKHARTHRELLANPAWRLVMVRENDRNGWAIWRRK